MKPIPLFIPLVCLLLSSHVAAEVLPEIRVVNGTETLILPDSLNQTIKSKYAGFRVPSTDEIQGIWASNKQDGRLPYVVWADFNDDGLTDVFLLLISGGITGPDYYNYSGSYIEVLFLQQSSGEYSVSYENRRSFARDGPSFPQQIEYILIRKGKSINLVDGTIFHAETNSIMINYLEIGSGILYIKNGKIEEIDNSHPRM